jgi:hypothetical protein
MLIMRVIAYLHATPQSVDGSGECRKTKQQVIGEWCMRKLSSKN